MDFREAIQKNNRRTKLVIGSFIFIMFSVGLLADVVFNPIDRNSLINSLIGFITLEAIPFMTIIITSITAIGVFLISKKGHKLMLSGKEFKPLDERSDLTLDEKQLLNIVHEMALSAGLSYVPKTYIMDVEQLNAFAAGWNENNAVVAVTSGLMNSLTRAELQAVVAHEVGHIIHGDSKLTLYVGILSNVILTFTNILAYFSLFFGGSNSGAANKARIILIILNVVLPIITQILYLYLSRKREYMADAAAVYLTGDNQAMISALQKISSNHEEKDDKNESKNLRPVKEHMRSAAYIYSKGDSIFSTHPSIDNRLKELGYEKESS